MNKLFLLLALMLTNGASILSQDWSNNFESTVKLAKKTGHPILLVFQGSDWCAPCIKMKKEIWSSDQFKAFSSNSLHLVEVDFPRRKKNALSPDQQEQNAMLAEQYNEQGYFPYAVILNSKGETLDSFSYDSKKTPQTYINLIRSIIEK